MSELLLVVLIGAGQVGALMVALGVVSIWRGRLPTLADVVVVLVAVAAVGIGLWLHYGPGLASVPVMVDRVLPSPYGPPAPGWTGVPG